MKKLISMMAVAAFLFVGTVNAQESKPQEKEKKECSSKEKKCCSKDKKSCHKDKKAEDKKAE